MYALDVVDNAIRDHLAASDLELMMARQCRIRVDAQIWDGAQAPDINIVNSHVPVVNQG